MTSKLFNLAQMSTATTGTGTVTLTGPTTSYRSFAAAGAVTGDVVPYAITDGSASECGVGTLTIAGSVTTMTRTLTGSTTGALLDLSGGAVVSLTPRAEDLLTPTLTPPSWSVVSTAVSVNPAVSKTLYNVTGQVAPVTITLPSAPVPGDAVAVFMADAVTINTLTVDAGTGRTIAGYGQTDVVITRYTFRVYRCIAALTWVVESNQIVKGTVTLTANVTSTVVTNASCTTGSHISLSPITAHAANGLTSTYWIASNGSFTIYHASNAYIDRNYTYAIL